MKDTRPIDHTFDLLIADLGHRQQELIERGRNENYLFVVYFTSLAVVITVIATLVTRQYDGAAFDKLIPTLVLVGSLVMLCLPVNFVHLACTTELRRIYIRERLEPLLCEYSAPSIGGVQAINGPFTFEEFDRDLHHGTFNILIGVRAGFVALPSATLLGTYIVLRISNTANMGVLYMFVDPVVFLLGVVAVTSTVAAYFRMSSLITKGSHAPAHETE